MNSADGDTSNNPSNEILAGERSRAGSLLPGGQTSVESTLKKEKPKNVPVHLWEKFKSLEKRTNETIQRSTEKRIKHLQKKVLETVAKEFVSEEERDVLKEHDIELESLPDTSRKRKLSSNESSSNTSGLSTEKAEIISLMSVNNHLQTTDHSRPPPETALEKRLALAIKEGDFSTAEAMSDKLATLEAGEKVAAAFDAKRFLQQKEVRDTFDLDFLFW
ncbi:protein FAM204A-like isoform X1 [Elysia marginata]|uniref:Protein FAM204A-like isoform X1 n=1 Tax=Elysia marginata TaxID=1093978 RepID=A0AAV4ICV5_9GAST|nr:protein FAM204A-like isoform X1 [Elysia marginata]